MRSVMPFFIALKAHLEITGASSSIRTDTDERQSDKRVNGLFPANYDRYLPGCVFDVFVKYYDFGRQVLYGAL